MAGREERACQHTLMRSTSSHAEPQQGPCIGCSGNGAVLQTAGRHERCCSHRFLRHDHSHSLGVKLGPPSTTHHLNNCGAGLEVEGGIIPSQQHATAYPCSPAQRGCVPLLNTSSPTPAGRWSARTLGSRSGPRPRCQCNAACPVELAGLARRRATEAGSGGAHQPTANGSKPKPMCATNQ